MKKTFRWGLGMWFSQQSAWHSGVGPEFGPIAPMGEKNSQKWWCKPVMPVLRRRTSGSWSSLAMCLTELVQPRFHERPYFRTWMIKRQGEIKKDTLILTSGYHTHTYVYEQAYAWTYTHTPHRASIKLRVAAFDCKSRRQHQGKEALKNKQGFNTIAWGYEETPPPQTSAVSP